jgi:hypothetical protein
MPTSLDRAPTHRSSSLPRVLGAAVAAALAGCGSIELTFPDGGNVDPHTPDARVVIDPIDAQIDARSDAPIAPPDGAPDAMVVTTPNLVFVTSTHHDGNLGGVAGADAICQARAQAAGLPGTYRAWLSTAGASALSRLGSASGWVRPDGKLVARSITDLAGDHLFYPPRLDELGHDVGDQLVRTATGKGGAMVNGSDTCGDYHVGTDGTFVAAGEASGTGWLYTAGYGSTCADATALYCFGIDRSDTLPTPTAAGRRAFATSGTWAPGTGLASADALCQQEAQAAGVPGAFKALLATVGASALSRFDLTGAPWVRVDGVALAPTAAALGSAAYLDASPGVTPDGVQGFGNDGVWTGGALTAPGTTSATCNGWTSTTATGTMGQLGNSNLGALTGLFPNTTCDSAAHLICLAQ